MLYISFDTFTLQWLLYTSNINAIESSAVISEHAARQLIRDLKLGKQDSFIQRSDDGDLLGYIIRFTAATPY
jgi:hypothetical protein